MGFIPLGNSIGTQIMLEYKDSNYTFIALCQEWAQETLTTFIIIRGI